MKTLSIILLMLCQQVPVLVHSQGITLSLKNASLEDVFTKIEQQSSYRFVYTSEDLRLSEIINISVEHVGIEPVLWLCFKDQPLDYVMEDNFILVHRKTQQGLSHIKGQITLKGYVSSENGEALESVNIQVKDPPISVRTDRLGSFELIHIDPSAILLISCMGYESLQLPVNGKASLDIHLKVLVSTLDQTIVQGYFNSTQRLNTGTVNVIPGEVFSTQPVTNPLAALEGRATGLFITQSNGLPGSDFTVMIRGRHSIQSGNAPLYIVDGVPFLSDADRLTQRSGIAANSPFNSINPNDIERVEILKDADATAIYGSRGANGVILIITKQARPGKFSQELNVSGGWERTTRTSSYMKTASYLAMRREAFRNDGITPDKFNAPDLLLWDTTRYTDWQKLLIGGTAHLINAQIRISGGSAATSYTLGGNFSKETTVFPGDQFDQRTGLQFGIYHHSLKNRFQFRLNGTYVSEKSIQCSQDITKFSNLPPNAPELFDSLGRFNWKDKGQSFTFTNPLALLRQTFDGLSNRFTTAAVFNYRLLSSLNFQANIGINKIRFGETLCSPLSSQDPDDNPYASTSIGYKELLSWIAEPQLEYQRGFGKCGRMEFLLGGSWQVSNTKTALTDAGGFSNDALIGSIESAPDISRSKTFNEYRYMGLFGRLHFQCKSKYVFNFTFRRDGSSRFGPGNQFANFGSIGLAWVFSTEPMLRKNFPWLSFGKLRGSYGITGNDQIGDYQYLDTWTTTQYPYGTQASLYPSRLSNPGFEWESNKKLEAALELGFLKDRIHFQLDWYDHLSENQLVQFSLPAQTGFSSVIENFPGKVRNSGWEFEISYSIVKHDALIWTTALQFTFPRNRLIAFPGLESSAYSSEFAIGYSLNTIIGYHYSGVDPKQGVYSLKDINHDGKMDQHDYLPAGNTDPVYYGSWWNSTRIKGWQLDFLFQFIKQLGLHPIYNNYAPMGNGINQLDVGRQRWQKQYDLVPYEQYSQDYRNPAYQAAFQTANSNIVLTDASYIRLKTISLSYQLPEKFIGRLKLIHCRLFVQGQNLITWTAYPGADPENQHLFRLPPMKTMAFGLSLTF
jgi:TonB-dependent starch-binding outer membrane protein SusC